jgi:hypothetical protein
MKKIFFIAIVLLVGIKVFGQSVPFEMGATKHDSIYIGGIWINEFSTDGSFAGNSNSALPTEAAVKHYADSVAAASVNAATQASVDSLADTTAVHNTRIKANLNLIYAKQDSISMHMDSIKAHNNRIIEIYSVINSKQDSIDAHTDSIQSHNARIIANYNLIQAKQDSLDAHTDSLQAHNTRLQALETSTGVNTICVQYVCTTDTTSTTPNQTGYFIGVYEIMNGYNLVKVEAQYANSQGDMTLAANVWRNRSGTEIAMTTAGASFLTNATIDPNNDDIATGDRLEIRWTYTGGSTAADGFMVLLTFQEP